MEASGREDLQLYQALDARVYVLLSQQSRAAEATPFAERELALARKLFADGDCHLAPAYTHLATAKMASGDYRAAIPLLERSSALATSPSDADIVLDNDNNLALGDQHLRDLARARTYFERARDGYAAQGKVGAQHAATASLNLGELLVDAGELDAAAAELGRAAATMATELGQDHPLYLQTLAEEGTTLVDFTAPWPGARRSSRSWPPKAATRSSPIARMSASVWPGAHSGRSGSG